MGLDVVCHELNGTIRCVVEGDLDLAGQAAALAELIPAIERSPEAVVLDLSGVEFIDSTGLRVLLTCQHRAAESQTRLLLGSLSDAVQRLFEVTKLADRFDYQQDG